MSQGGQPCLFHPLNEVPMVEEGLLVNPLEGKRSLGGQWQADIFFPHSYPSLVSEWFTMRIHFLLTVKVKSPHFPVILEDMKNLGGLTIFLQKQAKKGVIYFKQGEVLEILAYPFKQEGFFIEEVLSPTLWLLRVIPFSLYRKL